MEERNEWRTLRWRKEIAVMTDATMRQGQGKAKQAEGATGRENKLNSTYVVPGGAAAGAVCVGLAGVSETGSTVTRTTGEAVPGG